MSGQQLSEEENSFEEVEEVSFTPSYQIKLFEFMQQHEIDTVKCYLYKFDDPNSKSLQKSFIEKYIDREPPDEDEIGRTFGSGRYILCVSVPGKRKNDSGTFRGYKFRIHPRYDEIRENAAAVPTAPQNLPTGPHYLPLPQQQSNGMKEAFSMIKDMMALFVPLMAANNRQPSGLDDIMSESYAAMNNVMKNSMMENFRMFKQFTKAALLDQTGDDEEMYDIDTETERQPTLLEQFAPLLNEWLPKLLGGGVQGKMINQVVQSTPQFQQLINDKVELRKVIKYLVDTRGPEETDKILTALNIPHTIGKPAGPAAPAAPGQRPAAKKTKRVSSGKK